MADPRPVDATPCPECAHPAHEHSNSSGCLHVEGAAVCPCERRPESCPVCGARYPILFGAHPTWIPCVVT